jgi:hypothetical protein
VYEPKDEFERELKDGLRLREAPEGFAERVLALADAAEKQDEGKRGPIERGARVGGTRNPAMARPDGALNRFQSHPTMRWSIAAALLVTVALGGYAERQRQIAGERARQQVFLALRITGSTLRAVHDRVADGDE